MTGECPREIDVGVYLLDRLEAAEAASFTRHLTGCPSCRAEVDDLAPVARLLAALRDARPDSARGRGDSSDEGPADAQT